MKIRPLGNRVLVSPDKLEETTKSGIFIPPSAKRKPKTGIVEAIGEEVMPGPLHMSPGDRIIFDENIGSQIEVEGKSYLIMRDADVIATYGLLDEVRKGKTNL